jgi:predicted transcriptional regulator
MDDEAEARKISPADIARIDEGIAADERGDFATEEEVRSEFARWRSLRG